MRALCLLLVPFLLAASSARASIIRVPGDVPTIQAAIAAAKELDTVLIAPGLYSGSGNVDLEVETPLIAIRGEGSADSVVISGSATNSIFRILVNAPPDSGLLIENLTIDSALIGLNIESAIPVSLQGVRFRFCDTGVSGGQEINVQSCLFDSNSVGLQGGRYEVTQSQFLRNDTAVAVTSYGNTFDSCLFDGNTVALTALGQGDYSLAHSTIRNGEIAFGGAGGFVGKFIDSCLVENITGCVACGSVQIEVTGSVIRRNSGRLAEGHGSKAADPHTDDSENFPGDFPPYVERGRSTWLIIEESWIDSNTGPGISNPGSLTRLTNVVYSRNAAPVTVTGGLEVTNSTFVGNDSSAVVYSPSSLPADGFVHNSIFAFNGGAGFRIYPWWSPDTTLSFDLSCNNFYFNSGGDMPGVDSASQIGNLSAPPRFCDTASGDYTLLDISSCATGTGACSLLIGALAVGCSDEPPVITGPDTITVTEGEQLAFVPAFTDTDGPDTLIGYPVVPSWCAVVGDTLAGVPTSGDLDTLFVTVVSDGYKADTQAVVIAVVSSNSPPIIGEVAPQEVFETRLLEVPFSASDANGDPIQLTMENLPTGATFVDSGNGQGLFSFQPTEDQAGIYDLLIIASDGAAGDSAQLLLVVIHAQPMIAHLRVLDEVDSSHVVDHQPGLTWTFSEPQQSVAQMEFEIAVGTDSDWTSVEMWEPPPFASSDTLVLYSGAELVDGSDYVARIRAYNGIAWSDWHTMDFRLNSAPSAPLPLTPIDDIYTAEMPTLWVANSLDPEGDSLRYEFLVFTDSTLGPVESLTVTGVSPLPDSTPGAISPALTENGRYSWQARAHDGFEFSPWSLPGSASFWVNGILEPPANPSVILPVMEPCAVSDLLPTFIWSRSLDPDPLDTVTYRLCLAPDQNFDSLVSSPPLWDTVYTLTDSLVLCREYAWLVVAEDNTGDTAHSAIQVFWTRTLGDINNDRVSNIADLTLLVEVLFKGEQQPCGPETSDIDGNCVRNVGDLTALVNFLFRAGLPPEVSCEQ